MASHGGEDTSSPSRSSPEKLSPVVVLAHGAGAPSSSDWMIRWKNMLGKALNAVEVVTFDYPYISGGRRRAPPKAEKLVEFHADIVKKTVAKYPGHPLILAGKSMGSRVSCMVACDEDIGASAIVCLGYPLKGMNGAVRDETLLRVTVPIMFVQGSKDTLCPLEKLEAIRKKMKSLIGLHVIDGGDHSFKIGKKHLQTKGSTQDEAEDLAVQAIAEFMSRCIGARGIIVIVTVTVTLAAAVTAAAITRDSILNLLEQALSLFLLRMGAKACLPRDLSLLRLDLAWAASFGFGQCLLRRLGMCQQAAGQRVFIAFLLAGFVGWFGALQ